MSHNVKSLFTNVPIQETIYYILDEICVKSKLSKICSKLIFKPLLLKLTTESNFMFISDFCEQTDGCTMGGPVSVIFSDIYVTMSIHPNLNFTNASWMILLIEEIKINLMTYFRNLTATI